MWMENDSEVHGGKMMHASKLRVLKGHLLFPVSEFGILGGLISPERARFRDSHRQTSLNTDTNSTSSQNNRLVTDCATDVLKDCLSPLLNLLLRLSSGFMTRAKDWNTLKVT